jgi:hypothetical protein
MLLTLFETDHRAPGFVRNAGAEPGQMILLSSLGIPSLRDAMVFPVLWMEPPIEC